MPYSRRPPPNPYGATNPVIPDQVYCSATNQYQIVVNGRIEPDIYPDPMSAHIVLARWQSRLIDPG